MALPSAGAISFSQVNTELGRSSTQNLSMSDSGLRTLFNDTSGAISMSSGWGKSSGPSYPSNLQYLVIAGGAGGSSYLGSGGGAGGMLEGTRTVDASRTYVVTVGAGGGHSSGNGNASNFTVNGIVISNPTGGGFGVGNNGIQNNVQIGNSGGSGGGSYWGGSVGGSGIAGQGHAGGNGASAPTLYRSGGGGGAGQAGGNGGNSPVNGGNGRTSNITGTSVTYAGGGAGGTYSPGTVVGQGGTGGGGHGGGWGGGVPSLGGQVTTGSGGGGGGGGNAGGSGIVFIKVPTVSYSGSYSGTPNVSTSGTDTILKFTSSGSYTS